MEDISCHRRDVLKKTCETIILEQPEAIGMVFVELDCGCINVCGVSAKGDPIGSMQTISGHQRDKDNKSPVCLKCYKDKKVAMDRVVNKGLVWPGDESERPEKELRLCIGQKVFGLDYTEKDP